MNLGALFEAYGQTAGPFFKGQADAEQTGADERRKNIESWIHQQELGNQQQESARRQQFGQQELDLRQKQLGLDTQREQRMEQQEAVQSKEAEMRAAHLQFQMKTQTEDRAREASLRDELSKVDWTDEQKAREQTRRIMLKYADPKEAAGLLRYTPKQEEELAFTQELPTYLSRLNNLLDNPTLAKFAPQYAAAMSTKDRREMDRVEARIARLQQQETVETDRKTQAEARQHSLDETRRDRAAHWKVQEQETQDRLNIIRGKVNAVKPTDKNGAKELQGYITRYQKDRADAYSRIKAIDAALTVPTISQEDAIGLRSERAAKMALAASYEQAIQEAELRLKSVVFGTGNPVPTQAPTGAPASGASPPVVPPSPSSTPAAKPQGIRVPLPGGGEAIVTPH